MKEIEEFAVEITGLRKSYRDQTILKNLDLAIRPGERVGLMGPSGAGKSTLLNCIAAIDLFEAGRISINGCNIGAMSEVERNALRREQISTVFQFFHLLPTLTVRENVELPLQLQGTLREETAFAGQLMQEVGISHRQDALPEQLSGGEMQRAAIARALITKPAIILADEPTGNLDSKTGDVILDLLARMSEQCNTSLLLVTHNHDATRICHRTLHMLDGILSDEP